MCSLHQIVLDISEREREGKIKAVSKALSIGFAAKESKSPDMEGLFQASIVAL